MRVAVKNIEHPDELRKLPNGNGHGAIVNVGGMLVVRGELQPGWRWSNDPRALAGTVSCEYPHTGIILAGCLHIEMDDGSATELRPGDVYRIPSGHDAWVVGNEPVHTIDWSPGTADCARPPAGS